MIAAAVQRTVLSTVIHLHSRYIITPHAKNINCWKRGKQGKKKRSIWKLVRKTDIMETISAENVGKQDHVLESWLTQTCTAALHPRVWEIWGPGDSEFTRVYVVQSDFLILWLMGFVLVCVQQQPHKDGADFRRARASRNTRGVVLFLSQRKVSAAFLTHSLSSSNANAHFPVMHVLPKAWWRAPEKSKAAPHTFTALFVSACFLVWGIMGMFCAALLLLKSWIRSGCL